MFSPKNLRSIGGPKENSNAKEGDNIHSLEKEKQYLSQTSNQAM